PGRRGCTRRFERCVLLEDPPLERSELGARLEPDLFREPATERLVGGECVPRPVGAVEAEHQLAKQSLLERVLADELLELADQSRAAAGCQLSADPSLQREEPSFFQPLRLRAERWLRRDVGERMTAPQSERVSEPVTRSGRVVCGSGRASLLEQCLEALEIELARLDTEQVTGPAPLGPVA